MGGDVVIGTRAKGGRERCERQERTIGRGEERETVLKETAVNKHVMRSLLKIAHKCPKHKVQAVSVLL